MCSVLRAKTMTKKKFIVRCCCVHSTWLSMQPSSYNLSCSLKCIDQQGTMWAEVKRKWALAKDWQPFTDRSHSAGTQRWVEQERQGGRASLKSSFPLIGSPPADLERHWKTDFLCFCRQILLISLSQKEILCEVWHDRRNWTWECKFGFLYICSLDFRL